MVIAACSYKLLTVHFRVDGSGGSRLSRGYPWSKESPHFARQQDWGSSSQVFSMRVHLMQHLLKDAQHSSGCSVINGPDYFFHRVSPGSQDKH